MSVAECDGIYAFTMSGWSSRLVVRARSSRGLSQRALAARAGVPASTVNRVELGKVSPTTEMLDRLLAAAGAEVVVTTVPSVDGALVMPGLNESERRSLVMGVLTAHHLLEDPVAAVATARRNLARMATRTGPATRVYLDEWSAILEGTTEALVAVLTGTDEHARALRQTTPFAGVVPDAERRAALRRLRVA